MTKLVQSAISFDKEFLKKLKNEPNSCVHIQKDVKRLPIHPFRLTDIGACLRDIFQKQIAKYDYKLNGILLGYQNVRVLECNRETFDGSFTHLDIEAEFYVFRPVIGSVLNGIVNKKSKDHVGCLVYKTFNASLPRPKNDESWLGYKTQIGSEIQFKIVQTNMESKLPYIKGEIESIISDDSGFSTEDGFGSQNTKIKFNDSGDEDQEENEEETQYKSKKEINFNSIPEKDDQENLEESLNHQQSEYVENQDNSYKKPKKRKKSKDFSLTEANCTQDETIYVEKEKLSKRKYEEVEDNENDNKKRKRRKSTHSSNMNESQIEEGSGEQTMKKVKRKKEKHQTEEFVQENDEIVNNGNQSFIDDKMLKKRKNIVNVGVDEVDASFCNSNSKDESIKKSKRRKSISTTGEYFEGSYKMNKSVEETSSKMKKTKRKRDKNKSNDGDLTQEIDDSLENLEKQGNEKVQNQSEEQLKKIRKKERRKTTDDEFLMSLTQEIDKELDNVKNLEKSQIDENDVIKSKKSKRKKDKSICKLDNSMKSATHQNINEIQEDDVALFENNQSYEDKKGKKKKNKLKSADEFSKTLTDEIVQADDLSQSKKSKREKDKSITNLGDSVSHEEQNYEAKKMKRKKDKSKIKESEFLESLTQEIDDELDRHKMRKYERQEHLLEISTNQSKIKSKKSRRKSSML